MKKFLILFLALGALNAPAASSLPSALRTDGKTVVAAFGDVEKIARQCTVTIYFGSKAAVGTLLNKDGLVVTKYSEFVTAKPGKLRIVRPGIRRFFRGNVVAHDKASDLIFISTNIEDDPGFTWAETDKIAHATWVVAGVAGSDTKPYVRAGITSANARKIPKKSNGVIGIKMADPRESKVKKGVLIKEVTKKGPAEKSGMKNGDVILSIDAKVVNSNEELFKAITSHDAGDTITVVVVRKEEEKTLKITLGFRDKVFAGDPSNRKSRNDKLSGSVSVRRTGFEKIIQHEVTLATTEMGGPLLDLKGRLLGINIARRNRVEFFALPASIVQKVIKAKAAEIAKASKDKTE
jgi:S1-C subfamily serine protease